MEHKCKYSNTEDTLLEVFETMFTFFDAVRVDGDWSCCAPNMTKSSRLRSSEVIIALCEEQTEL